MRRTSWQRPSTTGSSYAQPFSVMTTGMPGNSRSMSSSSSSRPDGSTIQPISVRSPSENTSSTSSLPGDTDGIGVGIGGGGVPCRTVLGVYQLRPSTSIGWWIASRSPSRTNDQSVSFEVTSKLTDWSFVLDGDLDAIHQPIDVLGLNWYTPRTVRQGTPPPPMPTPMPSVSPGNEDVEDVFSDGDRTEMGWIVDPSGLEELLLDIDREFPGIPVVITENGCAYDDPVVDGRCHDVRRIDYLQRHVTAVHRALEAGANVVGSFVWSLLDNYEWSFGYSKRFGITHVDFETQQRTPRDSALWYTKLARTHEIPEADGF